MHGLQASYISLLISSDKNILTGPYIAMYIHTSLFISNYTTIQLAMNDPT